VVIGDNRPYIATLLTLDPDELQSWLTKNDRGDLGTAELVNDPQLRAELQKNLDLANKTVSAAEGIRRFVILPVEFTEETGYLTPKLSVKRHLVLADFAEQVESLY
jgi:long-chain acyl-CoA synthetase